MRSPGQNRPGFLSLCANESLGYAKPALEEPLRASGLVETPVEY
jgi:hypothetical protein